MDISEIFIIIIITKNLLFKTKQTAQNLLQFFCISFPPPPPSLSELWIGVLGSTNWEVFEMQRSPSFWVIASHQMLFWTLVFIAILWNQIWPHVMFLLKTHPFSKPKTKLFTRYCRQVILKTKSGCIEWSTCLCFSKTSLATHPLF